MSTSITCPVSAERINENAVRVAASLVVVITIVGVLTRCYPLILMLGFDFGLRAFTNGKLSIIKQVSIQLTKALRLPSIPVNAAPKKFAAGVGALFCMAIFTFGWFEFTLAAYSIAGVLVLCAVLESVFAYCVGCVVYSLLQNTLVWRWAVGARR